MSEKQLQMDLWGIPQDDEPVGVTRTIGRWAVEGTLGKPGNNEREKNDFYATDPIAAEWLCELEDLHHDIWECACGKGHLAKVFAAHGHNVRSTDLIDRGYGQGGVNFFLQTEPWGGRYCYKPTLPIRTRVHRTRTQTYETRK